MAAPAPRAPFARLRHVLLAALALALGGLGLLYWIGKQGTGRLADARAVPDDTPAAGRQVGEDPGTIATSEGFSFEQKVAGRPVFKILGDHFRAASDNRVELEGVNLELYRDGEPYQVVARRADWNPGTQEATLDGDVVVSGGDAFSVATDRLELTRQGTHVRSAGPVRIRQGDSLEGRANGLELDFTSDVYELRGDTRLTSQAEPGGDAVDLSASRIRVDRRRREIRAEEGVVLTRGPDRLSAEQLTLFLGPDEKTPQSIQARWSVTGELVGAVGEDEKLEPVRFSAHETTLDFEGRPARPARITLEAERGGHVVLVSPTRDGRVREIAARYLVASLVEGKLSTAQGFQPVFFSEYPVGKPGAPLRTGQADQTEAEFGADGRLARITLIGRVSFREGDIEGRGERGFVDLERGRAELFGRAVRLVSDRGELVAPHVSWDRSTGLTSADGGVQAKLEPEAARLVVGASGGADGPVRVDSEEAFFQENPRGFLFRGKVQAWQGENVLFADQLRGEEDEGRLSAGGGVRTLLREAPSGTGPQPETEIISQTLAYRRQEGVITWSGDAKLTQGERVLTASELIADLDEDNRIERFTALRPVRLEERGGTGRVVVADKAVYDLSEGRTLFSGSPVELVEGQGTKIQGRRLEYDHRTGRARVLPEGG